MKRLLTAIFVLACALAAVAASAQDSANPEANLAKALRFDSNRAVFTEYEVKIYDGRGGIDESTLLVLESQTGSGRAVLAHLRQARNVEEQVVLSVAESGPPQITALRKGKARPVKEKHWQRELGDSFLWPIDFLARRDLVGVRTVSGVNLNGQEAWLLSARLAESKVKYDKVNVWLLKDRPLVVQYQWLNKQGFPEREAKYQYGAEEGEAATLEKTQYNKPTEQNWTELTVRERKVVDPAPIASFTLDLVTDKDKREAFWP